MIPLPSGTLPASLTCVNRSMAWAGWYSMLLMRHRSPAICLSSVVAGGYRKILWADADGLCLFTRRLERGRFAWPSAPDGKVLVFLTPDQLAMLLECIDWRQPKIPVTSLTML